MEYVTARGVEIPALGFGTGRMETHEERVRAIRAALEAGYRHLDTAQAYGSEDAVGEAIARSDVAREDVFVTTKLADNRTHDAVVESTRESLDDLDAEYVDLLLIHWPNREVPLSETIGAMNELRDDGLVRHLGVSNFSVEGTREAIDLSDAPIVANQVEYNVRERADDVLAFCIEEGLCLTAYSPLAVGELLDDDALVEVARRHDATPAQVAIRWLLEQPQVSAIPMSSSPDHVRENFGALALDLTDDEVRELFALTGNLGDDLAATLGL